MPAPYLTHTRSDGTPDTAFIEHSLEAFDRAREEGEARAMQKIRQALTDPKTATKLLRHIEALPNG